MKIAYVLSEEYSVSPHNGVRIQAQEWGEELIRKGENVIFVNPWEIYNWAEFDVVHIFGPVPFIRTLTNSLIARNNNQVIVYSPIIDTNQAIWKYKIASHLGCDNLRLSTHQYNVRHSQSFITKWFVRSQYEFEYVHKAYDVPANKISIIPLSYRIPTIDIYPSKESFCFHVSSICQERKNVMRLIDAAIKYKFKLVLAGVNNPKEFEPYRKKIEANENIIYLGRISDDKLIEYYKRAKVFVLPSLYEGVGMVAVEAAAYGDDIVVTNLGGPKEYYGDMAFQVDPYNVDDIGINVLRALETNSNQPKLMRYIKENYNLSRCVDLLLDQYKSALITGM